MMKTLHMLGPVDVVDLDFCKSTLVKVLQMLLRSQEIKECLNLYPKEVVVIFDAYLC